MNLDFSLTGRTNNDGFSSAMYWYSLADKNGWTKVSYKRGNQDHLRRLGHSAVYYPNMRSIIVFGGVVPERPRVSVHSNKLLAFQVDLEVWSELAMTSKSGDVPKGRSFHSSVLVGDYLVIYGKHSTVMSNDQSIIGELNKQLSLDHFQGM